MTIATYAELLTGIRDWLARDGDTANLPDSRLGDLVTVAEAEIYDRLRIRAMETSADLTVNARTVALPSGFIELRRLYIDASPLFVPDYYAPADFWQRAGVRSRGSGRPTFFTVEGQNFVFDPTPDATYTGKVLYYARLAALSSATNALFLGRPTLYLYGALKHAAPFIGEDSRIATWAAMFETQIAQAQSVSDRGAYAGTPLVIRPG